MRSRAAIRLAFSIGAVAFAQHASISGTAVDSSGEPVRKAIVTLTWQGTPRSWATDRTDGSGKFKFENLPAGKYDLRANKGGFGVAIYGARSVREAGEPIELQDGERRDGVRLQFISVSSISGRVLDGDGDPVSNTNVTLLRVGRDQGKRVLVTDRGANTNDRGEFRFFNIPPGQYSLHVVANNNTGIPGLPLPGSQYYGGASEQKDAALLTVRGGESLNSADFRLTLMPAVAIRGRVSGARLEPPSESAINGVHLSVGGRGRFGIQVILHSADESSRRWSSGTGVNEDGAFQLPDVAPGKYWVEAIANVEGKVLSAAQLIDAQPGMAEVLLALEPSVKLKGQIILEGQTDQKLSSIRVSMRSFGDQPSTPVGADGKFSFDQLVPGEWEMNLNPLPRGGYIKSAALGDKDVRFAKIPIQSGVDASLNIVISTNAATIEGSVDSPRAGILVAPIGEFHDFTRFYYSWTAAVDGKFKITGIAPGKYRVFALEKMLAANFRSPEAADQLGELGEVVELTEGSTVTVHPKLIPIERAREALP